MYQEYVKQQSSGKQTLSLLTQSGDYERILISHMENAVATGDGPFAVSEEIMKRMKRREEKRETLTE